ncbi:SOS response-associated peptidase [Epibacterium ulvae]|uniref:SOS response-associated peptidase n=1 Tax=Epibacterium ulvae TaxID=1156985 RepID=UPI001BFCA5E0|nr:SOS response-associated peptidase [Epibacterium ulvae]MBT8152875.1 SOS response-associated peptidase [Epibacterium ulvae]
MCGRFAVTLPPDAMAQLFAAQPANNLPQVPNYNVCPTNQIATIRSIDVGRQLVSMRWGFLPHWYKSETDGPLLINARAETLAQKPAFSEACRTRRCLIPADGFYEWTKDPAGNRLPWYFTRTDDAAIAFAGVWQDWGHDHQPTCAIVTTEASDTIQNLHHRMPLILDPSHWSKWLGQDGAGAAKLMVPGDEDLLRFHRVHPRVNSSPAAGMDLIEPFDDTDDVIDGRDDRARTENPHDDPQGHLF